MADLPRSAGKKAAMFLDESIVESYWRGKKLRGFEAAASGKLSRVLQETRKT